jgi:hypothetical protein
MTKMRNEVEAEGGRNINEVIDVGATGTDRIPT